MATSRELHTSILASLARLERHLDAIEGTEWRHDLMRALGEVDNDLNSFADFADEGGYKPLELANGAAIERYEWIEPRRTPGTLAFGLVLAKCETDWVTWEFSQQADGTIECGGGHYFNEDRGRADDDYDDRVRQARRQQRARQAR